MIVIMRRASLLYAQGAECTKACFGQSLLTPSVCQASPASCIVVSMRRAYVFYAQGAEGSEACFGKAF